ncbi:MAG: (d)CMP kinase [Anaerovoracaceae bacterium]|nr:(d)CMP kinase [Anaerovoracaceae bacterium]
MITIAIDGPGGAGKSTIAKLVAKRLDIDYIDTGAMYRAIAYKTVNENIDTNDDKSIRTMLDDTEIDFIGGSIYLDGQCVDKQIRTPEISQMASKVSALGPVREKLVELQRKMGHEKSVIMDGRDIGTNVLTDAAYKFFMTASAEERAQRRYKELIEKGESVTFEQVLSDINQRDKNDMERELNPLRKAEDATEIDTTGLSIEEVADVILKNIVSEK